MRNDPEERTERRLLILTALMALWMGAWGLSLWAWLIRMPSETGLPNDMLALGWQGIAALLAFMILGIGFGLPGGHGARRMSAVPSLLALLVAGLAYAGIF
ncbi:MAG: hypothetical protein OEZ19_06180 [Paracoccaceae bacterium]|nr:hypothetical protein [Paracoccaceae bacterium]